MDVDAEDNTSHIHGNAPIAAWTTIPLKNVESHRNRPVTPLEPVTAVTIVAKVDTEVHIAQ